MKQQIKVTTKYHMEHCFEEAELSAALTMLQSEEGCDYNFVERCKEGTVRLRKTEITCPYCGFVQVIKNRKGIRKEQLTRISEWDDSLPEGHDYEQREELSLFSTNLKTFICPHCGCKSDTVDKFAEVLLENRANKVIISCEVKGVSNILALPYLLEDELQIEFPYYEQIEFNFRKGHVCIRGVTSDGKILHSSDVTYYPQILGGTEFSNWFGKFVMLKQAVRDAFEEVTKAEVPYEGQELMPEDLVYLTRFVGYDRFFYSAIPYDKETLIIDKSFESQKWLHTKEKAMDYLSRFSFAKFKSLKRQICEMPGLLFYLPECEALFRAVQDINVVSSILEERHAFDILLYIHNRPRTLDFFKDFCEKKGAVALYNKITAHDSAFEDLKHYMSYYCSLSEYGKIQEQMKWHGKQHWFYGEGQNRYSLPVVKEEIHELTDIVKGFSFRVLRNTSEYYRVGTELNNCLKEWDPGSSVVVSVSYAEKVVAAIEVDGNTIEQAYAYGNQSIENVAGLSDAFDIWVDKNKLKYADENDIW